MQLVGAHQILGLLGDLPLDGGQEFGGNGGVQDITEHMGEGLVLLRLVPGHIGHQTAHQGLGDGGIDTVHAHVVAVVGGPAQGQLREVSGTHHQSAALVGHVHEHLGALPGLAVLKGHIVVVHGLANVLEVLSNRRADVDAPEGGPQPLGQLHGVVPGALGGAEAGHGDGNHVAGRPVHQAHGHAGDEDGQGGVQPAGQAHHRRLCAAVLHALFEAQRRQEDDLVAVFAALGAVLRDEGQGVDMAGEGGGARLQGEGYPAYPQAVGLRHGVPLRSAEGIHPPPFIGQALHVDLTDGESGGKPPLGHQGAVLSHDVMAVEDQVCGGLPLPGVGVDIAAHQPGGLAAHQSAAVLGLAHQLVGGGQVEDDGGPRLGQGHGGGLGGPQILADLHSHHQPGHGIAGPELPATQADLLAAQLQRDVQILAGGEPPLLIELPVIGQPGLGYQAQDLPPVNGGRAVVELSVPGVFHRQAQRGEHIQVLGGLQDGGQPLLRAPQQGILEEQVAAGVAGEAQLGQGQHPHPLLIGLPHEGENLFGVVAAVGHPDLGRAGGHLDESIAHRKAPPYGVS